MKKGLLVAVMIFAVVFGAFADTVVEPSVSGSATLTWGMDLDEGTTGFKALETSASIEIVLVDEATAESTGEGTWGYIKLENYKITDSASTAPDVAEAKIILGDSGAYIKIDGQPSLTSNMAPAVGSLTDVGGNATVGSAAGFTFGYDMDMVSLGVEVVSDGDWTANPNNDYAFGVDMTITPADVFKAEIAFNYGDIAAGDMGFSVKPTLTLADVMNGVDAWVGFDGFVASTPAAGEEAFKFDVGFGTTLNFSEANGDDNKANMAINAHYSADDLDLKVAFTEPTSGGLAESIGFDLTVTLTTMLNTMAWDVVTGVEYSEGGITPGLDVHLADGTLEMDLSVAMGADFHGIDNTDFTLLWDSGNLSGETTPLGNVTFATKISM